MSPGRIHFTATRQGAAVLAVLLAAHSGSSTANRIAAQSMPQGHGGMPMAAAPAGPLRSGIRGPAAVVSRAPTAAFDAAGRLWLVWAENRYVFVSTSSDTGRSFEPARRINGTPEDIDANSESRPKIAIGPRGRIYLTYTRAGTKPFTGDIRFSRSVDGGRTFSAPVTLNDDHLDTGHRFDSLAVTSDGRLVVAWIDKRDLDEATRDHRPYEGAALYYAVSRDEGRSFERNRKLKDNICECCRLALAADARGQVVLAWRDILPGSIRDHSMSWIGKDEVARAVTRVTSDGWKINACPHHGPSLAVSGSGALHLAWFTAEGPAGPGSFYARSTDGGRSFGDPIPLGTPNPQSHAVVFAEGNRLWAAWRQPKLSTGSAIFVQRSDDDGRRFAPPREVASTPTSSDFPHLVGFGSRVFLSWFTEAEGYRLVPLN